MPQRTSDHHEWLLKELADPAIATGYLNAALSESPEMFAIALRNVAASYRTGTSSAALYQTLTEEDTPRLQTVHAVLKAIGLKIHIAVEA
jgi:DNA-binding phage protein